MATDMEVATVRQCCDANTQTDDNLELDHEQMEIDANPPAELPGITEADPMPNDVRMKEEHLSDYHDSVEFVPNIPILPYEIVDESDSVDTLIEEIVNRPPCDMGGTTPDKVIDEPVAPLYKRYAELEFVAKPTKFACPIRANQVIPKDDFVIEDASQDNIQRLLDEELSTFQSSQLKGRPTPKPHASPVGKSTESHAENQLQQCAEVMYTLHDEPPNVPTVAGQHRHTDDDPSIESTPSTNTETQLDQYVEVTHTLDNDEPSNVAKIVRKKKTQT